MTDEPRNRDKAAHIVRDAGGEIIGRTKLQKVAYLMELAGFSSGFEFEYRHYGPYSEGLAAAIRDADAFGLVKETEHPANWGGMYSIFTTTEAAGRSSSSSPRAMFASSASNINPIELELAATAAYLSECGHQDPWAETAKLKSAKAGAGRLERAKVAYGRLLEFETPKPLPRIV
jgi:uncharacterized protein YwgA